MSMSTSTIRLVVIRHRPTGGVRPPRHRVRHMNMPKWMGSMPMAVETGSRMGVTSTMMAMTSRKQPKMSTMTKVMRKKIRALSTYCTKKFAIRAGTFSTVRA